jgi:hypothetical protein
VGKIDNLTDAGKLLLRHSTPTSINLWAFAGIAGSFLTGINLLLTETHAAKVTCLLKLPSRTGDTCPGFFKSKGLQSCRKSRAQKNTRSIKSR